MYYFLERPTAVELSQHYKGTYSAAHQKQLFEDLKRSYDNGFFNSDSQNLSAYLGSSPKRVLDFGSSYAFYLKTLKDKGLEVFGVEYDDEIAEYNKNSLGVHMAEPEHLDKVDDNFFDVIRAIHSIEHISDPRNTLSQFFRMLKPNGIVMLSTPCFSDALVQTNIIRLGDLLVYPDHLFYFTNRALARLLTDLRFSVEINISQFANSGQALELIDARGNLEGDKVDKIAIALEGIGAGVNSFVVARKPTSDNNYYSIGIRGKQSKNFSPDSSKLLDKNSLSQMNSELKDNDNTLNHCCSSTSGNMNSNENYYKKEDGIVIFPVSDSNERALHYNKMEKGPWQVVFPVQNGNSGSHERNSEGRVYVSGNIIVFKSQNPIKIVFLDSFESNYIDSASVNNNRSHSFCFHKHTLNLGAQSLKVSGIAAAEFVLYDLNFSGIIDSS